MSRNVTIAKLSSSSLFGTSGMKGYTNGLGKQGGEYMTMKEFEQYDE
jgi:hypothetical protein